MTKQIKIFFILSSIIFFIEGCRPEPKETPTKGYLKCFSDESLINVVRDEKDLFTDLYKNAKVDIEVVKAREGIAAVLNGDAKMFVSSRNLNAEEKEFVINTKSEVRILKFCFDALALIVNENEPMDKLTVDELKELLLSNKRNLKIYIPEPNSGVYEIIKNEILKGEKPDGVKILNGEGDVVTKIKSGRHAVGIIGLNVLKNIDGIKILSVGTKDNIIGSYSFYKPLQGYLLDGTYPLTRTAYIFLNEIGLHVASGFATFLTSSKGQKIVMKNNLCPATVPVKLVQLN